MSESKRHLEELSFYSESLQEDVTLLVYLPSNYSTLYKYSLLIAQDGKDYIMYGRAPRLIDELMKESTIDRTIFVGIPYKDPSDRREKYHPNGSQNEAYIRFLAHELIPFLDDKYPTYQMGKTRTLIGDSLAATVSLVTAIQYPNTFGNVIMHSPFVNEDVLKAVNEFSTPSLLDLYHVIGTQETAVKTTKDGVLNFIEPNRQLHEAMKSKGYAVFYDEFDGNHTWKYWQKDIKRSLEMMLR
ncbi:alpha/beta hydrolase [Priestia flexa]|uniref:Esterase family protein n=1 Tax=Priestia flexa TaxID=86664 RepID=A0ABU4J8L6_9BACI|nr:esterase family protein [Priestia flexa]MBY6086578.1 esterase family protein [Priestia flexa]MCA1203421.1 esterase family protein [Priestia flexa]MDW8517333.1 esterase family protein [Priestia flexa]SIQ33091.1 Enterochelin esterase [Priestia flexa]